MKNPLYARFSGALLGGMMGDIIGAVVEGESPRYLRKAFSTIDDLLALQHVEEILGGKWLVGRFTDDTLMSLDVAEWLIENPDLDGRALMARFNRSYRPARRYGPSTARILEAFDEHADEWQALATLQFPEGSYGNGSAMRAGPIGCFFHRDLPGLIKAAWTSSRTTHSHPLAIQGTILQAAAVAAAMRSPPPLEPFSFLKEIEQVVDCIDQDTSVYRQALRAISEGLSADRSPGEMAEMLGTGIEAREAVPMALYLFLCHGDDYEKVIHDAIFIGGDTDTIACMAGTISGAFGGVEVIPRRWIARAREEYYTPARVKSIAEALCEKMLSRSSR